MAGCNRLRPSSPPCPGGEDLQCEFERAVKQAQQEKAQAKAQARREREQTLPKSWALADQVLATLAASLADGMDSSIVHARTVGLCRFTLGSSHAPEESWICPLEPPLALDGVEFMLEYSPEGVLSVASDQLDSKSSELLLDKAVQRWRPRCQEQQFEQVEGDTHHEIYRCALPEGPVLVLGRFDRDLPADRWQLSFAMVAVG